MIKNKNIIISLSLISAILFAAVVTSGCTDYETYNNNLYAYSIQYPDTWDKDTDLGDGGVTFTNPEDGSYVRLACIDMDSYFYSSYTFEEAIKNLVGILEYEDDFDVIEEQYTTFKDYDAYEIEYTYTNVREDMHCKQIFFIDGDYLFALTYEATSDNYKDDLKTANKIMKSTEL
nr:PsbP-related protein [uncultured Methanolobus sp.]